MIPPSMMFIIYALFTQQSVAKLFAAGIVPGLLTAAVYSGYILLRAKKDPKAAPRPSQNTPKLSSAQKAREAFQIWPIIVIAVAVMGGIYTGLFTPTEAAAAGSLLTLVLGWHQKEIRKVSTVVGAMKESANTTAMLFLINIGALYYSRILAMTRVPTELTQLLLNVDMPPVVILSGILAIMFLLGMIMVPIGIYALTLPIVFPLIVKLGYDPIWFGVLALKLTEIGAITPPVGLNVYAMKGAVGKFDVSLEQIFAGIWPFCLCDIVVLVLLMAFPQLSLWLPEILFG
jgi:tripartite ATP-independent transporter DctM subunit